MLTELTHIKYESNTNITQSPGMYIFRKYLGEIVNQKVNLDDNKNRYNSE